MAATATSPCGWHATRYRGSITGSVRLLFRKALQNNALWNKLTTVVSTGCPAGLLLLYNTQTQHVCKGKRYHTCKITQLLWNQAGAALASGDSQGNAALWSVDAHSKLCLLATFMATATGPVSSLLFDEAAAIPALFYSVSAATSTDIYAADSRHNHSTLFSIATPTPLLGMFLYEATSQLVSVTAAGELFVHGTTPQDPKQWQLAVKLRIGTGIKSAAGDSKLMVAWVAGHILASASGQDGAIHMYDLETEDNYNLQIGMSFAHHLQTVSAAYMHMSLSLHSFSKAQLDDHERRVAMQDTKAGCLCLSFTPASIWCDGIAGEKLCSDATSMTALHQGKCQMRCCVHWLLSFSSHLL